MPSPYLPYTYPVFHTSKRISNIVRSVSAKGARCKICAPTRYTRVTRVHKLGGEEGPVDTALFNPFAIEGYFGISTLIDERRFVLTPAS